MPLRDYRSMPPGGLVYEQRDDGGRLIKKFASTTMPFRQFCSEITRMRVANGYQRSSSAQTQADVDEAQCNRLGNDQRWCHGGSGAGYYEPVRNASKGCASCGLQIVQ
jgi:hypothetical protein